MCARSVIRHPIFYLREFEFTFLMVNALIPLSIMLSLTRAVGQRYIGQLSVAIQT